MGSGFNNVIVLLVLILAVSGWFYGNIKRIQKKNYIENHQAYTKKLEEWIDKERQSSGLTARGEQPKEDQ